VRAGVEARVERERALEGVLRVLVAPFERGRHPRAEMEARVLRIGRERFAERFRRRARTAGVQRLPRAALDDRRARIDLRGEPGAGEEHQHQRQGGPFHQVHRSS
jgi:hypothetical protein